MGSESLTANIEIVKNPPHLHIHNKCLEQPPRGGLQIYIPRTNVGMILVIGHKIHTNSTALVCTLKSVHCNETPC